MDLVEYYNEYRILCCKVCNVGLHPRRYARHLYTSHPRAAPELASYASARRFVDTVLLPSLADPPLQPHREPITYPNPGDVALRSLKIFSGFGCTYCASVLPTRATANQHFNEHHAVKCRRRGGVTGTAKGKLKERIDREHYVEVIMLEIVGLSDADSTQEDDWFDIPQGAITKLEDVIRNG